MPVRPLDVQLLHGLHGWERAEQRNFFSRVIFVCCARAPQTTLSELAGGLLMPVGRAGCRAVQRRSRA